MISLFLLLFQAIFNKSFFCTVSHEHEQSADCTYRRIRSHKGAEEEQGTINE